VQSALPRLTRQSALRLLSEQALVLGELRNRLGDDTKVFFILAARPETQWETFLRNCIADCANNKWILLEITFILDGLWQSTGPDLYNGKIIIPTTPFDGWLITDF
jgi:hypothetical protein